jgi:hypothetical protein
LARNLDAWKGFPGGMPFIPDISNMNLTISGNALTGIKIGCNTPLNNKTP